MKRVLPVLLVLFGALANIDVAAAQSLNERWFGAWRDPQSLAMISFSSSQVVMGQEKCVWLTVRAEAKKSCVAYYSGSISKAALVQNNMESEKNAITMAGGDSALVGKIKQSFQSNRIILDSISNETFRKVIVRTPDMENGSDDCGFYYFYDKETVYRVSYCFPDPAAFEIRASKKVAVSAPASGPASVSDRTPGEAAFAFQSSGAVVAQAREIMADELRKYGPRVAGDANPDLQAAVLKVQGVDHLLVRITRKDACGTSRGCPTKLLNPSDGNHVLLAVMASDVKVTARTGAQGYPNLLFDEVAEWGYNPRAKAYEPVKGQPAGARPVSPD